MTYTSKTASSFPNQLQMQLIQSGQTVILKWLPRLNTNEQNRKQRQKKRFAIAIPMKNSKSQTTSIPTADQTNGKQQSSSKHTRTHTHRSMHTTKCPRMKTTSPQSKDLLKGRQYKVQQKHVTQHPRNDKHLCCT